MESAPGDVHVKRVAVKIDNRFREQEDLEGLEPMTPAGRVFSQPSLNCYILVIVGLKIQIDIEAATAGLEATLIKHKRFSSIVKEDKRGGLKWLPVNVNISDHIVIPFIDPTDNCNLDFVKNYTANLATAPPLDPSRPLWQIHFLRVRSEDAESSAALRIHHSLGDGVSLMSLFLACTRKVTDPQSLPTIPRQNPKSNTGSINGESKGIPALIMAVCNLCHLIWYTIVDIMHILATIVCIKDSDTSIKGYPGVETSPKQIEHAILSLEDFKIIKTAVNGDLADMMKSGKSGGARWGNNLGYVILPLPMVKQQDPLDYARAATALTRKKKSSWEAPLTYAIGKLLIKVAGVKVTTALTYRMISQTSISFSSIVGPVEEVEFFGHPIVHLIPTVSGHPHSLTIHFQSYMERVVLVVTAAPEVIRDPKQLCIDCVEAFHRMKQAAVANNRHVRPG